MTAATTPSAPARHPPPTPQLPRRPRRRIGAGVWLPVLAGILAVLTTLAVIGNLKDTTRIAVARADIRAGTPVSPDAFAFEEMRVPETMRARLLTAEDVLGLQGWVATHTIAAGDPVLRSDLQRPASASQLRTMSIPVDKAHAVGGELQRGDRVDVVDVRGSRPTCAVTGALVTSVAPVDDATLGAAGGPWYVTVEVNESTMLRLAAAIRGEKLEVVRSTGAAPASGCAARSTRGGVSTPEPSADTAGG